MRAHHQPSLSFVEERAAPFMAHLTFLICVAALSPVEISVCPSPQPTHSPRQGAGREHCQQPACSLLQEALGNFRKGWIHARANGPWEGSNRQLGRLAGHFMGVGSRYGACGFLCLLPSPGPGKKQV